MNLIKRFLWTYVVVPGMMAAEAKKSQYRKGWDHGMKNVINRLFEGEIFSADTAVPVSTEYRSAIAKVSKMIEELRGELTTWQNKKPEYMMAINTEQP